MLRICALALTLAFVTPAYSLAQSSGHGPVLSDSEINARRLFAAGEAAFDAERYESALAYFEEAYELQRLPALLYNIGVSAERAGNVERAIEAFEQYLADDAMARNRTEVEGRLRVLQRERAARTARVPPPSTVGDESTAAAQGPLAEDDSDITRNSGSSSNALSWSVVGASAAVAITGGVLLGLGARDYSTVENAADGSSWAAVRDAHDRAPRISNAGIACTAIGAVGAVIGIVLVVTRGHDGETDVAVTANGMSVRRSF